MTTPEGYTTRTWTALGTYVFLAVRGRKYADPAQQLATPILAEVDRTCSRFRDDSDLVRANRHPGRWTRVDPLLAAAIGVALEAAAATDGLVDPCLGRTLVALGYDADLGVVRERVGDVQHLPTPQPDAWREVRVTEDAVHVPDRVSLDLGATAKAWAADLVAASVAEQLGCPVLVSLGGDLRIDGPPADDPWPIRVTEHPDDDAGELILLDRGGLATSSTRVRRWETTSGPMHHLVDPRTARPVGSSLRTVSATGDTCVAANIATTAALVLGDEAGAWLHGRGITARLVHADGSVTCCGRWPAPTAVPA